MRTVIHHSIVGSAEGAYQYFRGSTAIESTFIVKKNGYFWQIMSLGEQADANFRANAFAGSIETEDNGNPDTDPWTPAQLDTLVWLSLEMRRLRPRSPAASAAPGPTPVSATTPCSPASGPTFPGRLVRGRSASGSGRTTCCPLPAG